MDENKYLFVIEKLGRDLLTAQITNAELEYNVEALTTELGMYKSRVKQLEEMNNGDIQDK